MPLTSLESPRSILLVRFGALGDVVLTTGALEALREAWPNARILYATKSQYAGLLMQDPRVDAVMGLDAGEGTLAFAKRLRFEAPEVVLDWHDKMRSRLLRMVVPSKRTRVWRKRSLWQGLGVRLRLKRYHADKHIAARYHEAVEQMVGVQFPRRPLRLYPTDRARARCAERLTESGVREGDRLVGLAAGAKWATKRWPLERFVEIAKRLEKAGYRVVLTGGGGERSLGEAIAQQTGAVDLTGALDVEELTALIARCNAYVANDSGPMHVARALRVPTLAFFGCTDPKQFDFTGHGLMYRGVPCAPCSLYGLERCPKRHLACMNEQPVDDAWQSLQRLLRQGQPEGILG